MVQGQPGPNMRAASYQAQAQQQQKAQGSGSVIMPIYTIGIVAFFIFTIVKIVMKKANKNKVITIESDPKFVDKVFKQSEPDPKKKLGESLSVLKSCSNFRNHQFKIFIFYLPARFKKLANSGWKDHNASKLPLNFPHEIFPFALTKNGALSLICKI
jgi:Resistance to inhibitors of cholinesterase homologue 3